MPTLIIYSRRRSDYTLDVHHAGVWVASAKSFYAADLVECHDDLPGIENEPPEPPVWPEPNGLMQGYSKSV